MRKKIVLIICLILPLINIFAEDIQTLREGFLSPPSGGGTQTWWHWTSLFVTREGITADLESMKEIGYEGLHLFITAKSPVPPGDYPEVLSPGWMDKLKFAGEEMQRLGLTFGFHNCPGWSLSGGPWMTPENSMQMLVSSEVNVSDSDSKIVLPQPTTRYDYYRDIAVLAFPDVNRHEKPVITADFTGENINNLLDNNNETFIRLPIKQPNSHTTLTFTYEKPYSPQFVELSFDEIHLFVKGTIETSSDGITFHESGKFDYGIRTDMRLPKCIRLNKNAENARFFRITFKHRPYRWWMTPVDVRLNGVRWLASSMVNDVETRNSTMEDAYSYKPFDPDYITPGINPSQILDLTDKLLPDGTLRGKLPKGNWTILRIGHTTTGKHNGHILFNGLECDKLNRRGLDAHWPEMPAKIIDLLRPTGVLKYAMIDSYEAGGQNWTEGFAEEFIKRRGYALKPYLPAVIGFVVGTPQESARFLYDFQRTIAELMAENYYDYFAELCRKNGLLSITETYLGPFDYLRCARHADVPTGEFWAGSGTQISRMPGSAAHFHGRKRVMAESFTTAPPDGRWQLDPFQLKKYGDMAWIHGVSQLVPHSFVHQPFLNVRPGMTLGQNGAHLWRTNTWWTYGKEWVSYMNRSQFLLQSGLPVADMLILSGESAPNNYPKEDRLLATGYNYDFCCVDDLYDYVKVKDGVIVAPSGVTYNVLSLGPDKYLTLKTLRKVYELMESGAVISGVRPMGSPSLSDASVAYNILVEKIWGSVGPGEKKTIGKGMLINDSDPTNVMRIAGVNPDITLTEGIHAIHRRAGDIDIYYICNNTDKYISHEAEFRVEAGKIPEFWFADNSNMEKAPVWYRKSEKTTVRLDFIPRESRFVIFRPGTVSDTERSDLLTSCKDLTILEPPTDISTNWQVHFPPNLGAPESIRLDRLASLSEHPIEGVRYFSGTASYQRTISVPAQKLQSKSKIVLSLGSVCNVAEVKVNGKKVAVLWKFPFETDITPYLRSGDNRLEISVTNLWVNRIIGDARNPVTAPETDGWPDRVLADKPNSGLGHYTYVPYKAWKAEDKLQPSGLIGPVNLQYINVK